VTASSVYDRGGTLVSSSVAQSPLVCSAAAPAPSPAGGSVVVPGRGPSKAAEAAAQVSYVHEKDKTYALLDGGSSVPTSSTAANPSHIGTQAANNATL